MIKLYRPLSSANVLFALDMSTNILDEIACGIIPNATFSVSESGREQSLLTKKRSVHAFVLTEEYHKFGKKFARAVKSLSHSYTMDKINYNPTIGGYFFSESTKERVNVGTNLLVLEGRLFSIPDELQEIIIDKQMRNK